LNYEKRAKRFASLKSLCEKYKEPYFIQYEGTRRNKYRS
jgi:hypothetical protein